MLNVLIQIPSALRITDGQFLELVRANPDLRMERTAEGELIVMSPTGSEGGNYNAELTTDFGIWNRQVKLGKIFDSSTGFKLPNGATRSPDTAWIKQARWNALTPKQRQGFAPICPDFVLELASETDDIKILQAKMQEYLENGCSLGWLIDPKTRQVEIYRPDQKVEVLQNPKSLSGEDILPGFTLNLATLFSG
ncbi:MAG: Uma2 family endonuclease [Cyanobacteria bacterium P01_C01_bin.120]